MQELESLCEGVEGRSSNPVAVLFDALCHPDADLGADNPSVLEWRLEEEHAIDHVVLGKYRPGGAWQVMRRLPVIVELQSPKQWLFLITMSC